MNGNTYEGAWVAGVQQGEGQMVYADGGKYTGKWVAGKYHAKGILMYADGEFTTISPQSSVGQLFSVLTCCVAGSRYEGEFAGGLKDGSVSEDSSA